MKKCDEYLSLKEHKSFYYFDSAADDGSTIWEIKAGKSIDDNGEEKYKHSAAFRTADLEQSPFGKENHDPGFSLEGNPENYITVVTKEMNVLIFTAIVYRIVIWLKKGERIYALISTKVTREQAGNEVDEWLDFLNTVLASAVLDGEGVKLERLTAEKLNSEKMDLDELSGEDSPIPVAKPQKGQHTHLDFLTQTRNKLSLFGGMFQVNQTGTEYSFQSIAEMAEMTDDAELSKIYWNIADAETDRFELSETARDMAELFRVNPEFFDPSHDREQEIKAGMIQRAAIYNSFRSFAWTLQAYCEKESKQPIELTFDEVHDLIMFISERDGLNYKADSYSPVICSGDDIHNYYVPDSVSNADKNRLLKIENGRKNDSEEPCNVLSLNKLRDELTYMYPAVEAIYNELEESRDPEEPLTDKDADILYAWCSMTYAAREPFFSEDGPMNCMWEHPDNEGNWELRMRIDQLEWAESSAKKWLKEHKKDLSPENTRIILKDKKFVFTGAESTDEWLDALEKLVNMGGIHRTAVSGQTDYLVCNPAEAGDSKVRKALEQRAKGKNIKIVLYEDFLKAIGMSMKSPQQRIAELKAQMSQKSARKTIKKLERPVMIKKEQEAGEKLTYDQHLQAEGYQYTFDIPDGFVIKQGIEDRDFIAYLPDEDDPEHYSNSRIVIYAGTKIENDVFKSFRTTCEYASMVNTMRGGIEVEFSEMKVEEYDRKDLPGALLFGYDPGCLHANGYFGVGDHIQQMRVQINDVTRKTKSNYEVLIKELFDHMAASEQVTLLKELDEAEFVEMSPDSEQWAEWIQYVNDYAVHIGIGRAIWQNGLVSVFKNQQNSGNADVGKFKKNLKDMLGRISKYAETELRKAEFIYTLKRMQYPDDQNIEDLKEAVERLVELTTQTVNLDGQEIKAESSYAAKVKERIDKQTTDAVDSMTEDQEFNNNKKNVYILKEAQKGCGTVPVKEAEEEKGYAAESMNKEEEITEDDAEQARSLLPVEFADKKDRNKIDAFKGLELFSNNVCFIGEDDIDADNDNDITSINLSEEIDEKYKAVDEKWEEFTGALFNLTEYVNQNMNLEIPEELIETGVKGYTFGEKLTGSLIFAFAQKGLLKISEKASEYIVEIDDVLTYEIPEAYKYFAEFIQTLRKYNSKHGAFKITYIDRNDKTSQPKTMTVNEQEPYRNVVKQVQETRRREAEEKRKTEMYTAALQNLRKNNLKSVESAIEGFKELAYYRDSKAKLQEAKNKAEKLKIKKEIDDYQKNLADVRQLRERLLKDSVNQEKEKLNRLARNQFDSIKESGNAEINDLTQKKNNAQKELEQQGFFAFGKKSELKTTIKNCDIGIEKKKKEISEAEKVYTDTLQKNKNKIAKYKEEEQKRIEEENPLPQKTDRLRSQIIEMIYNYMSETGKSYTVKDLYGVFKDYVSSEKEFSSIITAMRNRVLISREVVRGTAYFTAI